MISDKIWDRANNDDVLSDTACLAVLRTSTLQRERRLPDFVAVGYQKCGTETLSFLDCHPNIVYRAWESPIFTNKTFRNLVLASKKRPKKIQELREYYTNNLPLVAPDEILIDKNSEYIVGPENHVKDIAKAIKIINANIKIITFVCDPNLRVVSKLLERQRRTVFKGTNECEDCAKMHFNASMVHFTNTEINALGGHESPWAKYHEGLSIYEEEFGSENVYVVDGESLISNPNLEFKMLLEFLRMEPRELIFQTHPDTNMPCLMQPILFCLNRSKGTSRQVRIIGLTW